MADIINSRDKDQKQLMIDFKEIVQKTNLFFKKSIISPLTITLGDEFQGIICDINYATQIIIFIEEELIHRKKDFKLRYVINEGEVDTNINTSIAFEMLGKGLSDARFKLQNLKNKSQRFHISIENNIVNDILNHSFIIFEGIVSTWEIKKDYELVSYFLKYNDYKLVANLLNRNRSLIWKREKSLSLKSYNSTKKIINISTEHLK